MKIMLKPILLCLLFSAMLSACKKDSTETAAPSKPELKLIFKFKFDSTQVRLNNLGNPSSIPDSNAGQSPVFHQMAAHYVELTPTAYTQIGSGDVLYNGASVETGGAKAIDFDQEVKVGQDEVFLSVPLKDIQAGTYNYLRVSLAYQNYDVKFRA